MDQTNWALEILEILQGLIATIVGGGLVLIGGWLSDRRKRSQEDEARSRMEKAVLTGMFAVRNYVAERIKEWEETGDKSCLKPLTTAQQYVHRLIDKAPSESETLMIAVIEIGLRLDALLASLEESIGKPNPEVGETQTIDNQVESLAAGIEQFDFITSQALHFFDGDELDRDFGVEERP